MRIGDIVYVVKPFSKLIREASVDLALGVFCAQCIGSWTYRPMVNPTPYDWLGGHLCPRDVFLSLEEAELFIAMYVVDPIVFPKWWEPAR